MRSTAGVSGCTPIVLEIRWLEDGQVLMMQSEAEQQADLERVGREMMGSMFPPPTPFSDLP